MKQTNKNNRNTSVSGVSMYMLCLPYPYMLILRYVCMVSLLGCLNKALLVYLWWGYVDVFYPPHMKPAAVPAVGSNLLLNQFWLYYLEVAFYPTDWVLHTAFLRPRDADCKYCCTHASALNHWPLVSAHCQPLCPSKDFTNYCQESETNINFTILHEQIFSCNRIKNLEPPMMKDAGRSHHSGGQGGKIKVQGQPELLC